MSIKSLGLTFAALAAISTSPAVAEPISSYVAQIKELNNSGVTGTAAFTYNSTTHILGVSVNAQHLAPNTLHPMHLHGRFGEQGCTDRAPAASQIPGTCLDGTKPIESDIPTIGHDDLDHDGFLETVEGQPAYGPVNFNIADPTQGRAGLPFSHPSSDAAGNLTFSASYDLATTDLLFDPIFMVDHEIEDLFPLISRVFVIHGGFISNGPGRDPGEVGSSTDDEFVVLLPVGAGEVEAVPEPAMVGLLGLGVLGLATLRRRKRLA